MSNCLSYKKKTKLLGDEAKATFGHVCSLTNREDMIGEIKLNLDRTFRESVINL